jgi:hypothetical protein
LILASTCYRVFRSHILQVGQKTFLTKDSGSETKTIELNGVGVEGANNGGLVEELVNGAE